MSAGWNGKERGVAVMSDCPVDPECYYRTKQQVEINTTKISIIEKQIADIIEAKLIAKGAVQGTKATMFAAGLLVIISVSIVISLFIAVISGKLSIGDFLKIVF